MSNVTTQSVVRQIESLYAGSSTIGTSDRELLERFLIQNGSSREDAFSALVARHGPMVLGVCRRLLANPHDAEDAFQAVFLVLTSRARWLRDPDLLGNWLYGIALRTARSVRVKKARQQVTNEMRSVEPPEACSMETPEQQMMAREQAQRLHAEIERLPGVFRVPIVLCYFEGLTLDQAASRLGCPAGTLHSRLARVRDRLRRGLERSGIAVPAVELGLTLSARSSRASISPRLCEKATRAALSFATGRSAVSAAAKLAHEVLRSMMIHKLKSIALTLLLLGVVATSAACLRAHWRGRTIRRVPARPRR